LLRYLALAKIITSLIALRLFLGFLLS